MTIGVPWGYVLGLVLFNISVGDMNSGIECILIKLMSDTKWSCAVDLLPYRMPYRGSMAGSRGSLCEQHVIKEGQVQVLNLVQGNPKHEYR